MERERIRQRGILVNIFSDITDDMTSGDGTHYTWGDGTYITWSA